MVRQFHRAAAGVDAPGVVEDRAPDRPSNREQRSSASGKQRRGIQMGLLQGLARLIHRRDAEFAEKTMIEQKLNQICTVQKISQVAQLTVIDLPHSLCRLRLCGES
jgi:hypothetical protein